MKNKKTAICIGVMLIAILGILFFNTKDTNVEEKILVKNIIYNGEEISLIEKIEKVEGKTSLILEGKNERKILDLFLKNNEIPVEIVDIFIFKTKKDEYIVAITNSYVKVSNEVIQYEGFGKDIYIYDSKREQVFGFEDELYDIEFDNIDLIIKKLEELEIEQKL